MRKIKVYDDDNEISSPYEDSVEVDAECIDGEEGILAFFEHKGMFCIASGDDGFWYLIYCCSAFYEDDILTGLMQFNINKEKEKNKNENSS